MPVPVPQFSHSLRQEVAIALNEFMGSPATSLGRMQAACARVCTESHAMYASRDEMVAGLMRLYAELPGGGDSFVQQQTRHDIYNALVRECVREAAAWSVSA